MSVHVPLDCGSATPTFGDPCESLEGDEPQRGKKAWRPRMWPYKLKMITYLKERQGSNKEVTDREKTALCGLMGGLQWPAFNQAHTYNVWCQPLLAKCEKLRPQLWTQQTDASGWQSRTLTLVWSFATLAPRRRSPLQHTLIHLLHQEMTFQAKEATSSLWSTAV